MNIQVQIQIRLTFQIVVPLGGSTNSSRVNVKFHHVKESH